MSSVKFRSKWFGCMVIAIASQAITSIALAAVTIPSQDPGTYNYQLSAQPVTLPSTFSGASYNDVFMDASGLQNPNNLGKWHAEGAPGASFSANVGPNPSTGLQTVHITVPVVNGVTAGAPAGPIDRHVIAPLTLTPNQRYRIEVRLHSNTSFSTTFRIGLGTKTASVRPDLLTRTFVLGSGSTCTQPAGATNDYICSLDAVFVSNDTGAYNAGLWFLPATFGLDVNIASVKVTAVNADPLNPADDKPRSAMTLDPLLFGLTINRWDANQGSWPAMKPTMLRLWSNGLYWGAFQPDGPNTPLNSVALGRFDAFTQLASSNGASVVMTLGMTPKWAASGDCAHAQSVDDNGRVVGCSETPNATGLAAWPAYVQTIASRHPDRVKYFELWNEVDSAFVGTGADLANLARLARQALNNVPGGQTNFKLIAPSITSVGTEMLDEFLAAGGGAYVDIFAFHDYQPAYAMEKQLAGTAGNVRLLLASYGLASKPIWDTEGAASCDAGNTSCVLPSTPSSEFVRGLHTRTIATLFVNGISNYDYFFLEGGFDNEPWHALATSTNGLNTPNNVTTDNGVGFIRAAQWLKGAKYISRGWWVPGYPIYVLPFTQTSTQTINYLIWNMGSTDLSIDLPNRDWELTLSSATVSTTDGTINPLSPTYPFSYKTFASTVPLKAYSPILVKH